jgi:hypothetical protein
VIQLKQEVSDSWGRYREIDAKFRSEFDRFFRVGSSEVYAPVEPLTPSALDQLGALHRERDTAWDVARAASERLFEVSGGRWPNADSV